MAAMYQPPYYAQQYAQQFTGYAPQMQPQPQQYSPIQAANQAPPQSLIWVQGEAAAKSYPIAPGNTVALWDSENQTIYIKSADASGMPSMKVLDYVERAQGPKQTPAPAQVTNYVSRDEFDRLKAMVEQMQGKGVKDNAEPAV